MKILLKLLLTTFLLTLGFEGMVTAFHLLNRPSDAAVYEGMAFLAGLFLLLPFALWRVWRWTL